ncbi:hypothetical protein [Sphingomonas suaedae]|uniref:hypothetical protein n=1 Tax=Sphingomonas suaedae TaxID=2599297 RepID=UPI00164577C0|nr:hypothetical protein [Sphingomonas suaedae]
MYLPREIKSPDTFDVREPELVDDRMPAGAGFLIIVCASLLFWLLVLLTFTMA